jgi:hypothetical protein
MSVYDTHRPGCIVIAEKARPEYNYLLLFLHFSIHVLCLAQVLKNDPGFENSPYSTIAAAPGIYSCD